MADQDQQVDAALRRVLEDVVLPAKESGKEYQKIFDQFMEELMPILKKDPLYREHVLVGSAPQSLRIWEKDEFDVHIVMNAADCLCPPDPAESGRDSGTAVLKMKPGLAHSAALDGAARSVQGMLDEAGRFVLPHRAVDRLYSAVTKAVNQMAVQSQVKALRRHLPAVTATVGSRRADKTISIDLVPVVKWRLVWPPPPYLDVVDVGERVVKYLKKVGDAKGQSPTPQAGSCEVVYSVIPKSPSSEEKWWLFDFYSLGERVFSDRGDMKNVIRLIKYLRNCESGNSDGEDGGWCHVSSYMIKTACFWEDEAQRDPQCFWGQGLGVVVVQVLRRLQGYFLNGMLPDFWFEGYNLMTRASVDSAYWRNLAYRLDRICNALSGPERVKEVDRLFPKQTK